MIDDYEHKFDVVVDRSEFEGEIVVPQHLRKSGGGFLNNRISGSGLLGSLTRSKTLLNMGGGSVGSGSSLVLGSVPDLSRSSVSSGTMVSSTGGHSTTIGSALLEESSDYKLKESAASGSDLALDMDPVMLTAMGSNQRITKSRGKKLSAAKSTNYLLSDDGVQLRRNSEDYYRGRQSTGSGGGGDGFEADAQPSQLLKSFQSRNLSMDRPSWDGASGGFVPPPPPSRASSTVQLHLHQNNSNTPYYQVQSHNHYHYDPTRYQQSNHSSHMKQIAPSNRPYIRSGSTNAISIMSVNNPSIDTFTTQPHTTTTTTHAPGSSNNKSPTVRRWDEGRSSLSRRPNTFMQGLTNRSMSTNSLASIGSQKSSSSSRTGGGKSSSRARHQLELQRMKEFNSYAALGSLDRKQMGAAKTAKHRNGGGDRAPATTMTLDRPRSHVNNNNNSKHTGGGDGNGEKVNSASSEVVAIRTLPVDKNQVERLSNGNRPQTSIIEGGHGEGGLYTIPRPAMERSLSEQPRWEQQKEQKQNYHQNDMGIEIVDKRCAGQRILLRTFDSSSSDAQVLFCESSVDGEFVTVDFPDDGEEQEGEGEAVTRRLRRNSSIGFNDSAA